MNMDSHTTEGFKVGRQDGTRESKDGGQQMACSGQLVTNRSGLSCTSILTLINNAGKLRHTEELHLMCPEGPQSLSEHWRKDWKPEIYVRKLSLESGDASCVLTFSKLHRLTRQNDQNPKTIWCIWICWLYVFIPRNVNVLHIGFSNSRDFPENIPPSLRDYLFIDSPKGATPFTAGDRYSPRFVFCIQWAMLFFFFWIM